MSSNSAAALVIGPELVDFLAGPVSIKVGSCSLGHVPSVAQAFGCKVAPSRQEVIVFLSESRSAAVLRDLRAGGAIAVAFSRPATHRTVQLKGASARLEPLQPEDQALIDLHGQRTAAELVSLGYAPPFCTALMSLSTADAVRVCMTPELAFDQTPGVEAGRPMSVES